MNPSAYCRPKPGKLLKRDLSVKTRVELVGLAGDEAVGDDGGGACGPGRLAAGPGGERLESTENGNGVAANFHVWISSVFGSDGRTVASFSENQSRCKEVATPPCSWSLSSLGLGEDRVHHEYLLSPWWR